MNPEDTTVMFDSYYKEAKRLQAKYNDQITLLVGLETEFIYDATLEEIELLQKIYQLDYMVGSVHHVLEHPIDFDNAMYCDAEKAAFERYNSQKTSSSLSTSLSESAPTEAVFLEYFDSQYTLLERLKPSVIGHFDLIRLFRPDHPLSEQVWDKIKRNVELIKSFGGLVEINSRAWKKNLKNAYPQSDILKVR